MPAACNNSARIISASQCATRMCTLWRCKSTPTLMTSHYGPTVVRNGTEIRDFTLSFDSALCKWGEFFTGNYIL